MPRKRDIDPGIWRSEQFLSLPDDATRLAFIAMISLADDLGVGRVADLLRYTSLSNHGALTESVHRARLALLFDWNVGSEVKRLYIIPNWCRYQYVQRPNESGLPLPCDWRDVVPLGFHGRYSAKSVSAHGILTELSQRPCPIPPPPPYSPAPALFPRSEVSSPSETHPAKAGDGVAESLKAMWNVVAAMHKLPAVRSLTPERRRQLDAFFREANKDLAVCDRAFRAAADTYAHMDGGNRYGLWNLVRPANRQKWIAAADAPPADPTKNHRAAGDDAVRRMLEAV